MEQTLETVVLLRQFCADTIERRRRVGWPGIAVGTLECVAEPLLERGEAGFHEQLELPLIGEARNQCFRGTLQMTI